MLMHDGKRKERSERACGARGEVYWEMIRGQLHDAGCQLSGFETYLTD